MARKPTKQLRELLEAVERKAGVKGKIVGYNGSGHVTLDFDGFLYHTGATPSDVKTVRKVIADVRRARPRPPKQAPRIGTVGESVRIQRNKQRGVSKVESLPVRPATPQTGDYQTLNIQALKEAVDHPITLTPTEARVRFVWTGIGVYYDKEHRQLYLMLPFCGVRIQI